MKGSHSTTYLQNYLFLRQLYLLVVANFGRFCGMVTIICLGCRRQVKVTLSKASPGLLAFRKTSCYANHMHICKFFAHTHRAVPSSTGIRTGTRGSPTSAATLTTSEPTTVTSNITIVHDHILAFFVEISRQGSHIFQKIQQILIGTSSA